MRALDLAQVHGDLRFQHRIDAIEVVLQQHVFRRDRRVRFQFEQPMAVVVLPPRQGGAGTRHSLGKAVVERGFGWQCLAWHGLVLRRRAEPPPPFGRT